jgi:hypothetical protein
MEGQVGTLYAGGSTVPVLGGGRGGAFIEHGRRRGVDRVSHELTLLSGKTSKLF